MWYLFAVFVDGRKSPTLVAQLVVHVGTRAQHTSDQLVGIYVNKNLRIVIHLGD